MPLPASITDQLRVPVLASPMFLCSGLDLVIEQCKAGIIGSFPSLNARPEEELDRWLTRLETALGEHRAAYPQAKVGPFAVNLIVNPANTRLDHDLAVCARHRVPIIITSLSAPRHVVDTVHAYGGIVLHDAIKVRHAQKALDGGVDGLILVCAGAGGHAGTTSPFALVNEVRRFFDGPLVLSGAITNGAGILAARAMGCDLAYVGTRFIATRESAASDAYKQMILDSTAADIVYTPLFSGVHGSYLAGSIRAAGMNPDALPVPEGSGLYRGRADRPKTWKDIWGAGQGVGNIDDVPSVRALVDRFVVEYEAARRSLCG